MTQSAQKFNAAAAAFTITLTGLASSATAGREGTALDISAMSPIPADIILQWQITLGTTPTINTDVTIGLLVSVDGTNFIAGATGSDAALTPTGGEEFVRLIEKMPVKATTSNVPLTGECSLMALLGYLPAKIAPFVRNASGVNLNATAANHFIKYRPISTEGV